MRFPARQAVQLLDRGYCSGCIQLLRWFVLLQEVSGSVSPSSKHAAVEQQESRLPCFSTIRSLVAVFVSPWSLCRFDDTAESPNAHQKQPSLRTQKKTGHKQSRSTSPSGPRAVQRSTQGREPETATEVDKPGNDVLISQWKHILLGILAALEVS